MTLAKLDPDTEMLALLRQDRKIQRRQNVKRFPSRDPHGYFTPKLFFQKRNLPQGLFFC